MRKTALLFLPSLLATVSMLSACGPKALTIGETAVDRAATCGVVAAAQARTVSTDYKAPLTVEARGKVLQYALLAGAEGQSFKPEAAGAVIKRMPELADEVTDKNWKKLVQPCAEAFPVSATAMTVLPKDPLVSAVGCDQMSSFMRKALSTGMEYDGEVQRIGKLSMRLDEKVAPLLSRAGKSSDAQTQAVKMEAMATFAKLGPPDKVIDACVARYS